MRYSRAPGGAGEGIGDEALGGQLGPLRGSRAPRPRRRRRARPARRSAPAAGGRRARSKRRSGMGTPITLPAPASRSSAAIGPVGDVHGGLGDAVHVDEPRPLVAVALEPGPQALQLERLAAEDDVSQRPARLPARAPGRRVDELAEGRRRLVEHRHPLVDDQLPRTPRGERLTRYGTTTSRPPYEQRAPHLPDREVERVGVEQRPDVVSPKPNQRLGGVEQARDVAVGDQHALGPAGRAGGVDDVGQGAPAAPSTAGVSHSGDRSPPDSAPRRLCVR